MSNALINQYIEKRYDRWHDYAVYHCGLNGMADEATDVLNEVVCSLLQKDSHKLDILLNTKKNGYCDLDFFVLKMIKLNASSDTSPYRSKYKRIPADDNVEYSRLEIIDEMNEQEDKPAITLNRMDAIRLIFDNIELEPWDRAVFEYKFFQDNSFSAFEKRDLRSLYRSYNYVTHVISRVLQYLDIIPFKLKSVVAQLPGSLCDKGDKVALDFVKTADQYIINQLKIKDYGRKERR